MSTQSLSREYPSRQHITVINSHTVFRLPIASQASYIRAALSAGKHVLSEKPVAESVAEAKELIKWYREEIEPKKTATWSVAENFRYLDTFRYAREKVQGLGRIVGFRVKVYGNIQEDGKFFSNDTHLSALFRTEMLMFCLRHRLEKSSYPPRRLPARRWCALHSWITVPAWTRDLHHSIVRLHNAPSGASATRRHS